MKFIFHSININYFFTSFYLGEGSLKINIIIIFLLLYSFIKFCTVKIIGLTDFYKLLYIYWGKSKFIFKIINNELEFVG